MKKPVLIRSQRTIIIVSTLVLIVSVFCVVQIGFKKSEKILIEKTAGLIATNLTKNAMSISRMLDTARKLSAASGVNKTIVGALRQAADKALQNGGKRAIDTYTSKDIESIREVESLLTYYRNTFFDYQVHSVIIGSDGCLYSVLDGVENSSLFSANFTESISKLSWYQDFLKAKEISMWVAPCSYSKSGIVYTPGNEPANAKQYLVFVRKIRDYVTQQSLGISIVSLCTDNFENMLVSDANAGIALLNQGNELIYVSDDNWMGIAQDLVNENASSLNGEEKEGYRKLFIGDTDYLINYATIPATEWKLVNIMTYDKAIAEIVKLRSYIYRLSFVIVIGSVAVCAIMLIYITMPLNRLFQRIGKMQIGNEQVGIENETIPIPSVYEAEMRLNHMLDRIEQLSNEALEQQKIEQNLQFEALRAQLNPHFLFNTLNTIKWSAMVSGAGNIAEMIASLGRLLESSMRRGDEMISLKSELDLVQAYVKIKNWTLKYRFELNIEVDEDLYSYMVFKYCLQPIVENSMIHGMNGMENGMVTVRGYREESVVCLEVIDNGCGMSDEQIEKVLNGNAASETAKHQISGIGLSSVNGMIKFRYGKEYGLSIQSNPKDGGTKVLIRLPFENQRDNTAQTKGDECDAKGSDC